MAKLNNYEKPTVSIVSVDCIDILTVSMGKDGDDFVYDKWGIDNSPFGK